MFTLYYKPTCPFSQRVIQIAENLGVRLNFKDVSESDDFASEMLEKGGKRQTPFFVDTEKDVFMYESNDIIDYIRENKSASATPVAAAKPRVHMSSAVCESCEG